MPIVIAPNLPAVAVQGAPTANDIVLQPGSVISAQVVQILGNDQVRLAIGGQSIDAFSQIPLQAGQTLQLQVSPTNSGVSLAIVDPQGTSSQNLASATSVTLAAGAADLIAALATPGDAATNNQLTPTETVALSLAAQAAATQQTSLASLFANLGAAAGLPTLSPPLQQAIAQVLALRTSLDQNLSGNDIKQAAETSGLFLEASLAAGSIPTSNAAPDLKAALIVLRQALTTSLADVAQSGRAGAPAAAPATLPGAVPGTVQQLSTASEAAVLPGTTPAGTTPGSGIPPGATLAAATSARAAQSAVQSSSQAVTIVAGPQPSVASPIAPPLAIPTGSPTAATKAATPVTGQENLDLAVPGQFAASASTPADVVARAAASGAALNLLHEVLQAGPLATGISTKLVLQNAEVLSLIPAVAGARTGAIDDAELVRTNLPPPPVNGALPAAQPVVPATLAGHVPVEATLQHLLADADGALARQTLLQIASLPGQVDPTAGRADNSLPRWNFEIPFATPQGTAMAQFEISRDGEGNAAEPARRTWRARFSLNVEPAGPVHALVSLNGERTSVRMWAERPATASQLREGVSQLSQALSRADLRPGEIVVRDGAPAQPAAPPAGHFLDRAL